MGAACTRVMDVVPDKEVMLEIVDTIAAFEEKLKRGEQLTPAQRTEKRRVDRVTKEIKSLQKFRASKETLRPLGWEPGS